jgi:hypothetical protein
MGKTYSKTELSRLQFLNWYRERLHQYAARTGQTLFQVAAWLNKIPSSEQRNAAIDKVVDEQYKLANRPDISQKLKTA